MSVQLMDTLLCISSADEYSWARGLSRFGSDSKQRFLNSFQVYDYSSLPKIQVFIFYYTKLGMVALLALFRPTWLVFRSHREWELEIPSTGDCPRVSALLGLSKLFWVPHSRKKSCYNKVLGTVAANSWTIFSVLEKWPYASSFQLIRWMHLWPGQWCPFLRHFVLVTWTPQLRLSVQLGFSSNILAFLSKLEIAWHLVTKPTWSHCRFDGGMIFLDFSAVHPFLSTPLFFPFQ